jgi:predicted SAM-dependent methyltransferase
MKSSYINLACGSVFLENSNWINLDYVSSSKSVQKTNLLQRLPLEQETAELVYSSHFLEHIPYSKVNDFLKETLRILKPDGVLRVVLPDLEEMASNYVSLRGQGDHKKANFLVLEMIDQCVRNKRGGELGLFYQKIKKNKDRNKDMIEFIRERTGEDLTKLPSPKINSYNHFSKKIEYILFAIARRIERYWIRIILLALPATFRAQNISLAGNGECHHWVWDFYSLKELLETVGFINVKRVSAKSSAIKDFPFFPLDVDNKGQPRKGLESMYIEAIKPKI